MSIEEASEFFEPISSIHRYLKTLLDVLLGPVIALLSSAIGFYFGSRQAAAEAARPGPPL